MMLLICVKSKNKGMGRIEKIREPGTSIKTKGPLAPLFYLIIEVARFIAVPVSLPQVFRVHHREC